MGHFPIDDDPYSLPLSASASAESDLGGLHCTLNPSSSSQLAFSWSDGEIPVMLYDDAYVDDLTVADLSIEDNHDKHGVRERQSRKYISSLSGTTPTVANTDPDATLDCHPLQARMKDLDAPFQKIPKSVRNSLSRPSMLSFATSADTSDTLGSSFGAPGQKRRTIIEMDSKDFSALQATQDHVLTSDFFSSTSSSISNSITERLQSIDFHLKNTTRQSTPALSLSDVFSSPSMLGTPRSHRSSLTLGNGDETPVFKLFDQERLQTSSGSSPAPDESFSTVNESDPDLDTPKAKMTPSASWISSRDWDAQQYKEYHDKENLHRVPRVQRTAVPYVKYVEFDSVSPTRREKPVRKADTLYNRDLNVIVATPRVSQFPPETAAKEKERRNAEHQQDHGHHHTQPPKESAIRRETYDWMKGTTVQFLIDQEGFRAAQPSFKYTGVTRVRPPQQGSSKATDGEFITMAQFRPINRQSFHFHYAPFETCPNLRRLTVDFDENYDYLSRQALLPLKTNGVYVLHGYEMSHPQHNASSSSPSSGDPVRLHWQFEYLVDDRRMDASGKVIEGEKNLTPLSFSCSPEFVLPTQGKKNSIMQVFKKSVAPKLVAEKFQAPVLTKVVAAPSSKQETISPSKTEAFVAHMTSCKVTYLTGHKRGQSHSVQQSSHHHKSSHARSPLRESSNRQETQSGSKEERERNADQRKDKDIESVRRRRASSAGERHRHSPEAPPPNTMPSPHEVTVNSSRQRHAMTPAKLAEMMEMQMEAEDSIPSNQTTPTQKVHESQYTAVQPLTPRPRHPPRRHIRHPSRTR
ncbi:hypothetical protein D9613_004275 [Agrocybe pediades]|uniref:Uncharacterized protein n=1 Tax=Agrocybe pediades TaxID=84607 RepID=A0A8H4VLC6_9AGAR|nr:hypothetical protein D9613_004275 [Agrocybe pediades]